MENPIIEQVLVRNAVISAIIIIVLIGVLFLIRFAVKNSVWPKWSYLIWLIITLISVVVLGVGLLNIYLDIKEESYITYHGVYVERGGGQKDLKTVVVYDENGNEIRLLRTGASASGEYEGVVVYGERSKIIVEYSGTPKT